MTRRSWLLVASVALAARPAGGQPPAAGKRVALLVGVNQYRHAKLDNLRFAERDVTALKVELTRAGFDTRALTGPAATRAAYLAALADTLKGVGKADTVLLAFSGHGVQLLVRENGREREVPFFCPADANPTAADSLVSLNAVLKAVDDAGAGHNLLLVDACRSVFDSTRSIDGTRIDNLPAGTSVFFSCSSRQRARETEKAGGGHGIFFHFVLEGLRGAPGATDGKGRVTWERLVPFVKEQVREVAADWLADLPPEERQVPFAIGSLGDVPPLAVVRKTASAPPPPGDESDDTTPVPTPPGLRVASVRPDSAAERAGVKANDVVVAIDGRPVATLTDLIQAVEKPGRYRVRVWQQSTGRRVTKELTKEVGMQVGIVPKL